MATVERKPLLPPNSTATKITEADRAEIIARANDVINHYLSEPGSYFESGTQKPLVGELGDDTVADLKNFRASVIASMQFADDPNSIMRSVVELINQTIDQVQNTAQNNEGRDSIWHFPPGIDDPIDDPRVTSPRALSDEALRISLPVEAKQLAPFQAGLMPGISNDEPVRYLVRRIAGNSEASGFDTSAPGVPLVPPYANLAPRRPVSFDDRLGNWTSSPSVSVPRSPYQPRPAQAGRLPGIVSGQPTPDWPVAPPIWDFSNKSGAPNEENDDWVARLLRAAGTY